MAKKRKKSPKRKPTADFEWRQTTAKPRRTKKKKTVKKGLPAAKSTPKPKPKKKRKAPVTTQQRLAFLADDVDGLGQEHDETHRILMAVHNAIGTLSEASDNHAKRISALFESLNCRGKQLNALVETVNNLRASNVDAATACERLYHQSEETKHFMHQQMEKVQSDVTLLSRNQDTDGTKLSTCIKQLERLWKVMADLIAKTEPPQKYKVLQDKTDEFRRYLNTHHRSE